MVQARVEAEQTLQQSKLYFKQELRALRLQLAHYTKQDEEAALNQADSIHENGV